MHTATGSPFPLFSLSFQASWPVGKLGSFLFFILPNLFFIWLRDVYTLSKNSCSLVSFNAWLVIIYHILDMIGLVYMQPFVITIWKMFAIVFWLVATTTFQIQYELFATDNALSHLFVIFFRSQRQEPKIYRVIGKCDYFPGPRCNLHMHGDTFGRTQGKYVYSLCCRARWKQYLFLMIALHTAGSVDKQCQSAVFQLYLLWFDK